MDPYVLFRRPSRDVQVAYAGIIITFILALAITPLLHYFTSDVQSHLLEFHLALSILLSSTASPVLTRLITSLNIGKSDIGKLVIAAGMYSDFLSSLLLSVGYISMPLDTFCDNVEKKGRFKRAVVMNSAVIGQALFTATVSPIFMRWVNNENPEGKPMKGSHLVLSIAFMVMSCASSILYNFSPILTDFRQFQPSQLGTWGRLFIPVLIVMGGKVIGTLVCGAILGFHWPESVAIGLLLATKGHFHIYMAIKVA
ncbi:hypothetical protein L195_g030528, partial [Trifolium pratense]